MTPPCASARLRRTSLSLSLFDSMPWQRMTAPRDAPCAGWWSTPDKVSPWELVKDIRSSFMSVSGRHQRSDDCIAQLKPAQKLAAKPAHAGSALYHRQVCVKWLRIVPAARWRIRRWAGGMVERNYRMGV